MVMLLGYHRVHAVNKLQLYRKITGTMFRFYVDSSSNGKVYFIGFDLFAFFLLTALNFSGIS
jgi:hypothetical protein